MPGRYEYEPIKKGTGRTSPVIGIRFLFTKKKALPVTEAKEVKAHQQSQKKQINALRKALECAKKKNGFCAKQDNTKLVCEFCEKGYVLRDYKK